MNEFISLPLTAAQTPDMQIDPDFSAPDMETIMPPSDNELDPGFSVMPPADDEIDPDFSVMPPVYPPVEPNYPVMPPIYPPMEPNYPVMPPIYPPMEPNYPVMPPIYPPVPCLFCNNNQWLQGAVRLLNAATGYNAFTVLIDGRTASRRLNFPELTQYRQIPQGYHMFTVIGTNGYTYVRKSMYVGDGMATVAIINAPGGLDLTTIADTACPSNNVSACFRVCNLAYYSGPINADIGTIYFNSVNFKTAASFSTFTAGSYTLSVSRSARPETTLVSTPVTLRRRRIYTAYVLNWNPSPDTIQTLLVEDRRN